MKEKGELVAETRKHSRFKRLADWKRKSNTATFLPMT